MMRYLLVFLPFLGILDAGVLTWQHYGNFIAPCPAYFTLIDCGQVLRSQYAVVFGIPLALLGFIFYFLETYIALFVFITNKRAGKLFLLLLSLGGFLFSLYLVFLQLFVIKAICLYCMGSALLSTLFFVLVHITYKKETRKIKALILALHRRGP